MVSDQNWKLGKRAWRVYYSIEGESVLRCMDAWHATKEGARDMACEYLDDALMRDGKNREIFTTLRIFDSNDDFGRTYPGKIGDDF